MFVALDVESDRAVDGSMLEPASASAATGNAGAEFECLFCGEALGYADDLDAVTGPFEYFGHERRADDCCVNDSVSAWHRLGQEVVARALYNWLPCSRQAIGLDVERRIGTTAEFVIADIRVTAPIQLAVEVAYLNPKLNLRRRLRTLFEQGYAAMVVLLPNGTHEPGHVERSLADVGSIEVGRVNPRTMQVQFGSLITPGDIDFETQQWEAVPAYLC